MARNDPVELDEEAQPNRWPLAIAVSVFLHVVIVCEVIVALWPTGVQAPKPAVSPVAAAPMAPTLPIATPSEPAVTVASVPDPEPPSVGAVPPPPSAARQTAALAPLPADRPRDRLRPPPRREASEQAVSRATAPAHYAPARLAPAHLAPARVATLPPRPITRQRDETAPAYASVGDWVRAMSRMRNGDFAPRRVD
jgi:hypothetical protein